MERALVRADEALAAGRGGRARRNRSGIARRDVRLHPSQTVEWLGPCRHLGARAPSAIGIIVVAAQWTVGTRRANHCDRAGDVRPGSAGRLPGTSAAATPARTAAMAPSGARDLPSAGDGAGAVDLAPRSADRQGHVDLGVGQH